jgi:hypothetical protein
MQPGVSAHHAAQKLDFRRLAFRTGCAVALRALRAALRSNLGTAARPRAPAQLTSQCAGNSRSANRSAPSGTVRLHFDRRAITQPYRPSVGHDGRQNAKFAGFTRDPCGIRTGRRPPSSEIDIGAEKGNSAMGRRRKPDHIMSRTRIGHTVAPVGLQNLAPFPKSTI